ncbi:MAG: type IV pilus secretin PilQ [Desulfobacterales bacterium]
MDCKTKNMSMFFVHAISFLLLAVVALINGCAGVKTDTMPNDLNAHENSMVLSIDVAEQKSASTVIIQGNHPLTYTSVKQPFPMAVIIYLPNTSLNNFTVPEIFENEIISSISVFEPSDDQFVSRVEIALNEDVPYDIDTENNALMISFLKKGGIENSEKSVFPKEENLIEKQGDEVISGEIQKPLSEKEPVADSDALIIDDNDNQDVPENNVIADEDIHDVPKSSEIGDPEKNVISSIDVASFGGDFVIYVLADFPVDQYKTFTLKNTEEMPARIVVDMFNLSSPYEDENIISVNQQEVEQIRHRGYTDKVRLVVDTHDEYLSTYTAKPVEQGFEIRIKKHLAKEESTIASPTAAAESRLRKAESKQMANLSSSVSAAVVNRIEFFGLPKGKSAIILGMTRQIQYEVEEHGDKKILLRLLNTSLPEHHKRPLITTRFESAVDRVLPIQTNSMKDTLVSIELRQMVSYEVDQKDNTVEIRLEASSVEPKALEKAELPPWKQVMTDTLEMENVLPVTLSEAEDDQAILKSADASVMDEDEIDQLTSPDKKYTGEKIALDFFETDIKNVFRILREVSGKNFAIDKDVTGTVTLTLEKPVPWDQVLDLILKMNQLGKVEENDIIRIARMATITQEEESRRAQLAAKAQARVQEIAVEPLITEYLVVNYSDAGKEILPHLEKIYTKERGTISVDSRTNTVIITDTAEKIRQARAMVQRLDLVTPQVIIEARIVEANSTFSRDIGIQWSTEGGIQNDDPEAGIGPQKGYNALGGTWGYDTAVNLPIATPAGALGFQFSRIFGTPLIIDAKLQAMESLGEGKIVSAPKVMTLNKKEAVIEQGRRIPYSYLDEDGTLTTEFVDANLSLRVTPHVTADDRISLRVQISKNEVVGFTEIFDQPIISTKEAETELLINDGETIVIGGILQSREQEGSSGIPGLSQVPVVKWLFKSTNKSLEKEELLIFLTPRIMRLEQKNI